MPLQLTKPLASGDLDPNAPASEYTHCKALMLGNYPDTDPPFIPLNLSYGYLIDGKYVQGGVHPVGRLTRHEISGAKYVELVLNHEPDPGEKTYLAAKRGLYEHLVAEKIVPPGTVV